MVTKNELDLLTSGQLSALKKAVAWWKLSDKQYFRIFGYAGVGKSFTVQFLIKEFLLDPYTDVAFCTFTGNAAFNLIKKGNKQASTIHKLIYDIVPEEKTVYKTDKDGNFIKDSNGLYVIDYVETIFKKTKKPNLGNIKLIVLDECSMPDDELINDLLSFGIKTIMLGDPGQLPPVSGANSFMTDYDALLDEIVRQEADNYIINESFLIRNKNALPYGIFGKKKEVIVFPLSDLDNEEDAIEYYNFASQIICAKNKTRKDIADVIRTNKGIKGKLPTEGEKLICVANNWDCLAWSPKLETHIPLVNGTMGYCTNIRNINNLTYTFMMDFILDFDDECIFRNVVVSFKNFDEKITKIYQPKSLNKENKINEFDFGYAVTCHKSQGNQYKNVVIIAERLFYDWKTKTLDIENECKWLYTAITRAEKKVVLFVPNNFFKFREYKKTNEYWDSLEVYTS